MGDRIVHAIDYVFHPNDINQQMESDMDIDNDHRETEDNFVDRDISKDIEEETTKGEIVDTAVKEEEVSDDPMEDIEETEDTEEQEMPDQDLPKDPTLKEKFEEGKVAYLTFDDGPSIHVTPMLLETLKNRGITATFFVIGAMAEENPHILNRIYEDGHVIGNHTYSHQYAYIYKNTKNFADDILKWEDSIRGILGQDFKSQLFRFPGGSFDHNKSYHETVMDLGYEIFDWNVINGDGEGKDSTKEMLFHRFKETIQDKKNPIILMHDTDAKITTAQSLDWMIQYLLDQEYVFDTLNYFNKR